MKKIYEWLKENPRPLKELEYELLEFGINFYHIISLLWEQTTRNHTESFLIWKTREMLEILLNNYLNNNLFSAHFLSISQG